jgi:hypothetical protein
MIKIDNIHLRKGGVQSPILSNGVYLLEREKAMPVIRFKKFEDLEKYEREGKGISWNFKPGKSYFKKVLQFKIRIPIPSGLYKFKTFEEAERWEREWWIKSGATKRNR